MTIMTLEIRCSDVARKRLGFRPMGNKCLFSGPRDQLNLYVPFVAQVKNMTGVKNH